MQARRRIDRRLGLEDFAHWSTRDLMALTGSPPTLVLANNLHGGYFDLRALPSISHRVPLVLRLADSWTFTGHCAVPPGCGRWEHGCGSCPDLATPPAVQRDLTAYNWRRKRRIFARTRLFVTTPSVWLMERARRSMMAPAIVDARVIPNGVDLAVFSPGSREAARVAAGLEPNVIVLLNVSNLGAANPHKDIQTLRRALRRLGRRAAPNSEAIELLVVGAPAPTEQLAAGMRIRHLPRVQSRRALADLYRAADIYVHASGDESFCLTAAEALASGIPVVAAASGGLAEVVDDGRTGLLVQPGEEEQLADALEWLLRDRGWRVGMGRRAAETARARHSAERFVREMHQWCAEIVSRRAQSRYAAVANP
jgi:glycosyltransferase involved in cell wall biosynthesis